MITKSNKIIYRFINATVCELESYMCVIVFVHNIIHNNNNY